MEEQNEILATMKQGFARIDQRFESIDQRFESIDQRFESIDQRLGRIENDVSVLKKDTQESHLKLEFLIGKADLIKENVVDLRGYMARYQSEVEHPLEERVIKLEARVGILELKNSGTAAESPKRS